MTDPCVKGENIQQAIELGKSAHKRLDDHSERMKQIEDNNKILHEMNTNIKLMVQQNEYRDREIVEVQTTIKEIVGKPLASYEKLKWTIVTVVVTAFVMAILMSLPTIFSKL